MNEIFSEFKNHTQEVRAQGTSIEAISSQIEIIKKEQQTILASLAKKEKEAPK